MLAFTVLAAVGIAVIAGAFVSVKHESFLANVVPRVATTGPSAGTPIVSPTPVSAGTPTAGATTDDASAVLASINGYWQAIKDRQFQLAYTYLAPGPTANESTWVSALENDGITYVTYSFAVEEVAGDSATVDVIELQTRSRGDESTANPDGCLNWTGTYTITRSGSGWVIARARITPAPC